MYEERQLLYACNFFLLHILLEQITMSLICSLYFGTLHSLEILKLYDQRIYLYKLCHAISKSLITLKHIQKEKKKEN